MNGGLAKFGPLSARRCEALSVFWPLAFQRPERKNYAGRFKRKLIQMQATIKALQKQVEDAKAQAASAQTTADSAKGSDLDLKVKWKGAPQLSSGDGKKFTLKVRGRLEVDYKHANQNTSVNATQIGACR